MGDNSRLTHAETLLHHNTNRKLCGRVGEGETTENGEISDLSISGGTRVGVSD